MEFRVLHPSALYALLAIIPMIGLFVWDRYQRRRLLALYAEPLLSARLAAPALPWRRTIRDGMLVLAVVAMVGALVRPQFGDHETREGRGGVDVYLLVDVSRSMLVRDVLDSRGAETSRLERAQQFLNILVRRLAGDRIGLIPFTSEAFIFCPLTRDHSMLLSFVREISPELMGVQGTDIGNALGLALDAFEVAPSPGGRAVVIITDGEDHGEYTDVVLKRAADMGVRVHFVAIGSEAGGPVPGERGGFVRASDGTVVVSRMVMSNLLRSAALAGGVVWPLESNTGMVEAERIFLDLRQLKQAETEEATFRVVTEKFPPFILLALVLLAIEGLVPIRGRDSRTWTGRFQSA
jgi:Ca-activated chloride channel family protein